jgi:hypothetical protein
MDAHEDDLVDALLFAEVIDFLAAVADAVVADNVEGGVLAGPRIGRAV